MAKWRMLFLVLTFSIVVSVEYVFGGEVSRPPISVPTLNEWGMVGAAILLGGTGIYSFLRKQ